jgi:hypothetical protein
MTDDVLAIAWYTPETLEELRAVAEHKVAATYEEFVSCAEEMIADLERRGIRCEKVLIDIPAIVHWCRNNGYRVNSRGIAAYGATAFCMHTQMPVGGSA